MGILDKFLNLMRLDDDDDDLFDEKDYEEEDTSKKKVFFKRDKSADLEEEDDFDRAPKMSRTSTSSKVTPMRQPVKRSSMEVCVIKPTTVEDAREIAETLLSGRTVILNFEGLDLEVAQRIIDFTSGATFSIDGNLQKISNYIFLVTPTSVGISGDLQDLLNSSFEVPAINKSRY